MERFEDGLNPLGFPWADLIQGVELLGFRGLGV